MDSETRPRLRLVTGGRTHHQSRREPLAHLNQRRVATTRTREAIATAAAFATWCERASAELAGTDRVDVETLTDEWRHRANHSGIYGRAWYIDAAPMLGAIAALTMHLRTTPRLIDWRWKPGWRWCLMTGKTRATVPRLRSPTTRLRRVSLMQRTSHEPTRNNRHRAPGCDPLGNI